MVRKSIKKNIKMKRYNDYLRSVRWESISEELSESIENISDYLMLTPNQLIEESVDDIIINEKYYRIGDLEPDSSVEDINKALKQGRKKLPKYDLDWLIDDMENEIVYFAYKKKNGDYRIAKGTRKLSLIPKKHHPKGTAKNLSDKVVRYFDFIRGGWRSFRKTNTRGRLTKMV